MLEYTPYSVGYTVQCKLSASCELDLFHEGMIVYNRYANSFQQQELPTKWPTKTLPTWCSPIWTFDSTASIFDISRRDCQKSYWIELENFDECNLYNNQAIHILWIATSSALSTALYLDRRQWSIRHPQVDCHSIVIRRWNKWYRTIGSLLSCQIVRLENQRQSIQNSKTNNLS